MLQKPYFVSAEWDSDAGVWVATSDDVPGLITEAASVEALSDKLDLLVPDLLRANGVFPEDGAVAVEILARRFSFASPVSA